MNWLDILVKSIYGGVAAVGFAVLFNVPKRTLFYIFVFGAFGICAKFILLKLTIDVIAATLVGAGIIGIFSVLASYNKSAPAPVFSIPAVIPMVPGTYIYRMMIGIMELHGRSGTAFNDVLMQETITNGLNAAFVIMALSVGVSIPNLILRKEVFNELRSSRKPGR